MRTESEFRALVDAKATRIRAGERAARRALCGFAAMIVLCVGVFVALCAGGRPSFSLSAKKGDAAPSAYASSEETGENVLAREVTGEAGESFFAYLDRAVKEPLPAPAEKPQASQKSSSSLPPLSERMNEDALASDDLYLLTVSNDGETVVCVFDGVRTVTVGNVVYTLTDEDALALLEILKN